MSYIKPDSPIDGDAADALWEQVGARLRELLGQVKSEIVIAGRPPFES